jgi:hypothetical protein
VAGINCRHGFIPFNPETMTNNLKQYNLEENKNMYENHEKQRYFERNIRKYNRLAKIEKTAMENSKDSEVTEKCRQNHSKYTKLAAAWSKRYKKFSKDNNLRTQMDRTQI